MDQASKAGASHQPNVIRFCTDKIIIHYNSGPFSKSVDIWEPLEPMAAGADYSLNMPCSSSSLHIGAPATEQNLPLADLLYGQGASEWGVSHRGSVNDTSILSICSMRSGSATKSPATWRMKRRRRSSKRTRNGQGPTRTPSCNSTCLPTMKTMMGHRRHHRPALRLPRQSPDEEEWKNRWREGGSD